MDGILYFPRDSQTLLHKEVAPLSDNGGGLRRSNEIRARAVKKNVSNAVTIFFLCWRRLSELLSNPSAEPMNIASGFFFQKIIQ